MSKPISGINRLARATIALQAARTWFVAAVDADDTLTYFIKGETKDVQRMIGSLIVEGVKVCQDAEEEEGGGTQ